MSRALDQPDRKATSFVTSHFYLDDFVQSSKDPNPRRCTPLQAIFEEGFRTFAEATDKDVRLARRYQGYGGTRFVEDDLAGDPEAGLGQQRAGVALHHGPPAQHCRRRASGSGPQRRRGGGACSRAQNAAKYVRLNVLPRPAQPPPQIIGRPSDVELGGAFGHLEASLGALSLEGNANGFYST